MADAPISNSKGNVLLVDDDNFLVGMYGQKFASAGYTVQACLSVKEALQLIRGGFVPRVILFDITMPEQDGFALLKTLAEEHLAQHAIKIALTNQSDESEKAQAASLGASRYIVKANMIPSEVVAAVGEDLAKAPAPASV